MLKLTNVVNEVYTLLDTDSGETRQVSLEEVAMMVAKGVGLEGCYRSGHGFVVTVDGVKYIIKSIEIGTAVRQYDLDGKLIAEYVSLSAAGRAVGCSPSWLAHCCDYKKCTKLGHGFIWRRVRDDEIATGDLSNIPEKEVHIAVRQYTLEGKLVQEYKDTFEAARKSGIKHIELIKCLTGSNRRQSAGGFVWRYADSDEIALGEKPKFTYTRPVRQYSTDGKLLREFLGSRDAERQTGVKSSNIIACCKRLPRHLTAGGFVWRYADQEA